MVTPIVTVSKGVTISLNKLSLYVHQFEVETLKLVRNLLDSQIPKFANYQELNPQLTMSSFYSIFIQV